MIEPHPQDIATNEAEAIGFLRNKPYLLSHTARLRQRDRRRDHYLGLRARHRRRRLQPQLPRDLAEEGCFDRSEASHAVSLCDMHAKYADVVSTAEILSYFDRLPADLFALPTGRSSLATPLKEAAE